MATPDLTQPPSLQRPAFIWARGSVRPWDEAVLHVTTEGVQRGMNVFEGIKGFWQPDGRFGLRTLRSHYDRMQRSAALMSMPFAMDFAGFESACHAITACQRKADANMWIRATLFLVEGHWGQGDVTDLVLAAYHHPKGPPAPIRSGVSTWRRAADAAIPARIKSGFNYLSARFAKIEGRSRGYPEMVLLNDAGRVAEFIGSALVMVRDGGIATPPPSEGCVESITIGLLRAISDDLGVAFEVRPIERSELLVADEIAAVGTLNDVTLVTSIDERTKEPAPVLTALRDRYLAAATGARPHPAVVLSIAP